jgi:hypothetical protein
MSLAALTLGVLVTAGVTSLTILLAVAATSLAVVSRLIYRGRTAPKD